MHIYVSYSCITYIIDICVDYWYLDIYKASTLRATPQYKLLQYKARVVRTHVAEWHASHPKGR